MCSFPAWCVLASNNHGYGSVKHIKQGKREESEEEKAREANAWDENCCPPKALREQKFPKSGSVDIRRLPYTETASAPGRLYTYGEQPSHQSGRAVRDIAAARKAWAYTSFVHYPRRQPFRLKTRHKLSTHRVYPRLFNHAHSSMIPISGFVRRIF